MPMTFQLTDAAHFHGLDDYFALPVAPEQSVLGPAAAVETSWGPGALGWGEAGELIVHWSAGLHTVLELTGDAGGAVVTGAALYEASDAIWTAQGATFVPWSELLAGVDFAQLSTSGDIVAGNSFTDLLGAPGGSADFVGHGGDAVILPGSISQYTYSRSGDTIATNGPDGADTLTGILRIHFDDASLAFDVNGTAGEAYRLYQAAFDRAPDLVGLGFHIASLDHGTPLVAEAQGFVSSAEFQAKYGALGDSGFVAQMYANVLHRAPDPSGYAWWVQDLHAGDSRAAVLAHFSESAENQANVIGTIQHGIVYEPWA